MILGHEGPEGGEQGLQFRHVCGSQTVKSLVGNQEYVEIYQELDRQPVQ